MARKAEFGPKIYDIVESREEGMTKTEAFQHISEHKDEYGLGNMTGKHGSVAAAYYRVARSKAGESGSARQSSRNQQNDNRSDDRNNRDGASAVPPINRNRPGVKVDTAAPGDLAQQLAAKIEDAIRDAVEDTLAPVVAERDEAVARLKQIQAAFGQS